MRTAVAASLFFAISLCGAHGQAAQNTEPSYYIAPAQADLAHFLAPPPAPDSQAQADDIAAVLAAQQARSPADVERAQRNAHISLFLFADILGPNFDSAHLPFASIFFAHAIRDDLNAADLAKEVFGRPRPPLADPAVKPVVKLPPNASYPSGHATFAYATAILLARMVPEKAPALFARAAEISRGRVVGGVHYPTDIEAGRICGAVMDALLLRNSLFQKDFTAARAEVRQAAGLK